MNAPWRFIFTGAHASLTATLPDQSEFAVGPNSRIRVNDETHVVHVDRGQVTIDMPPGLIQSYVVETFLARATASVDAKFRVTVDASVQFDVYEGIVRVYKRGAKKEAPQIPLRKGDSYRVGDTYRVPVDAMASVVGGDRGAVSMMIGG